MGRRGEHNIGQLCRQHFGEEAVLIGFGTDRGTVMAASRWGTHPEVQQVRPSLDGSYGAVFRQVGQDRFLLDLRGAPTTACDRLLNPSGWSERSASCTCPQPSA